MKTKRIKIGFKNIRATLDDFVGTGEALARGEQAGLLETKEVRNSIAPQVGYDEIGLRIAV